MRADAVAGQRDSGGGCGVYCRVEDVAAAVSNVENAPVATLLLAQSALRNVLGARPLTGMLSARDAISAAMQVTLDEATQPWGIQIERVEMCAHLRPTRTTHSSNIKIEYIAGHLAQ